MVKITDPPFETTSHGITIKWKTVAALMAIFVGINGSSSAVTTYFGGSVIADQLKKHESNQTIITEKIENRLSTCEMSIGAITRTMKNLEAIQRIQVATDEARQITARIKNPVERYDEFVRLLGINIKRLSAEPPRETCHNTECRD